MISIEDKQVKTPEIIYLQAAKPKSTLSPIGFQKDVIYQAHAREDHNLIPYIKKEKYDKLLKLIEKTGNMDLLDLMEGK